MTSKMKSRSFSRVLWSVSIPVIFAGFSETVVHTTDTIFLARVGVVEVGAVGLAYSVLDLFMVLSAGLIDGIQILVARRLGQGLDRAAGQTFNQGLLLLTAVSTAVAAALALLAGPVTGFVDAGEVRAAATGFLQIMAFSLPFTCANFAYSALLVGMGRTSVLIWATVLLCLANVGLDYVFIFGHLGFPAMGIRGSAVGSLGAEVITFVFLTGYLLTRIDARRYGLFRFTRWDRRLTRSLGRISYPVSLQALVEALRWFGFFVIVEQLGVNALALSNIVYTCYAILRVPTEGFSETVCSMVSKLIGEGKPDRIRLLLREAVSSAYLFCLPFAGLAFLFPDIVLSLMADGPLIAGGGASLRVVCAAMLVVIPAEMWFVAVSGTGDTAAAFWIEAILTATMTGCGYLAAHVLGLRIEYVWLALPISWLACLALSYAWVQAGHWRRLEV